MAAAYIGIGSNIEPEKNIPAALRQLKKYVRLSAISTFYKTPPLGSPDSPPFYNGMVKIETDIEPGDLKLNILRQIEENLGRIRSADKNAPRTIDLDIIAYEDQIIQTPSITIPDPEITSRAFIAVPLFELDSEMVLPGSGIKLAYVVSSMSRNYMSALPEFTRALREEIYNE